MDDDIEMDDDHEHEPIEEPDYDEDDGDGDADEDDDDMDADDASADADDDDEDDGDGDADDASVAASRTGLARTPTRTTDDVLSSATYLRKVQQRRSLFRPSPASITTSTGYQIEPLAAAPHSSQIHAMALSLDGQTLLTGGSDGFVRKYNIHATMNGKTMLTQNVRHGFVEGITRGGNLTAFWPHEEHLPTSSSISSSSSSSSNSNAFSQSHLPDKDRLVGVIHSLAIQQDALWGLSGSESGNIHLCTIRHDPGSTRHVFRKHKGAVSALALTSDETTMISGGWDQSVHQWDLNTGKIVRSFDGFAGQISGLSFRPISHQRERSGVSVHASAAGNNDVEALEDQEDKARNEGRVGTPDRGEEDAEQEVSQVAKEDEEETFKSASADGTDQNKDADAKQADAPTLPLGDSHSSKIAENGSHANERSEKNGETSMSSEKSTADDNLKANDSTTLSELATDSTMSNNNDASSNVFSMSDKKATTPVPAVASSSSEKPVDSSASTSIKKEIDASGASSGVPGDDPTEEELAFEAELNASLGMSLDGSGMTKADGTRLDGVTANATGTTAGGLMVAGADEDDDDLFGGDTPPPSSGANDKEQGVGLKKENNASGGKAGGGEGGGGGEDSDGDDSLFGGDDEDADADADMDADADGDAEGENEDDDDGSSDEDMPLAGRSMVRIPSPNSILGTNGTMMGIASPSLSIALPCSSTPSAIALEKASKSTSATATTTASGTATASGGAASSTGPPKKPLPKPAFGGFSIASSFDAPLSTFSRDVMLSTSLSGQVILWDLRCHNYTTSDGVAKGVHSLPLPSKVPPWCQSAIFDSTGDKVFVGRRNELVDEWDLRMPSSRPNHIRSLRLPTGSGPVYCLASMPNARHIVCGSYDNIRLWDTKFVPTPTMSGEARVGFKIVAGHHGASLSSVLMDASCKFLISASGDRGWMGSSTEAVIIHDIKALI